MAQIQHITPTTNDSKDERTREAEAQLDRLRQLMEEMRQISGRPSKESESDAPDRGGSHKP